MGCLKGGVAANVVVPTGQYVRFAAHYGFRPDFCEAADPESKGIVENLVGYPKRDLMIPQAPFGDLAAANEAARGWCAEVNGVEHSEICAVPAERLLIGVGPRRALRRAAPGFAPAGGPAQDRGGEGVLRARPGRRGVHHRRRSRRLHPAGTRAG